jgi:hypothetical protein
MFNADDPDCGNDAMSYPLLKLSTRPMCRRVKAVLQPKDMLMQAPRA